MEMEDKNLPATQAGAVALANRETAQAQAQFMLAIKRPRNEAEAFLKAKKAFERPLMAEAAQYEFPRGGKSIKGPSVDLAREIARHWGNVDCGHRIVARDGEYVEVEGYAIDFEHNSRRSFTDRFKALIQRKIKGTDQTHWIEPDERDLRELCNRRGSICMRNALLALLPSDLVDECIRVADDTCRKMAKGELKTSRADAVRRLLEHFDKIGVTVAMIEEHLGHPVANIDEPEYLSLKAIGKSILDGNTKRSDHFNFGGGRDEEPNKADLNSKLKAAASKAVGRGAADKPPTPQPEPTRDAGNSPAGDTAGTEEEGPKALNSEGVDGTDEPEEAPQTSIPGIGDVEVVRGENTGTAGNGAKKAVGKSSLANEFDRIKARAEAEKQALHEKAKEK